MSRLHLKLRSKHRRPKAGVEAETGLGGRVIGAVFFGLFFAFGSFFLVMILNETWRAAETFSWDPRHCEILASEAVREGGEQPYRPRVEFRTIDGGVDAVGRSIRRGSQQGYASYGDALSRLAAYPVGGTSDCYASTGSELVLERGPITVGLLVLIPLIFVAIGAIGLYVTFKPTRRDASGEPALTPLGTGARRVRDGRWMARSGAASVVLGGLLTWFFTVGPAMNVISAKSWDAAQCTVQSSKVLSHTSDDGTTYRIDIFYFWNRGRGPERSNRYSFFDVGSSGYDGKRELVREYPKGAQVACWVDPTEANEAVLVRDATMTAWLTALPLVVLLGGAVTLRMGRRKSARFSRTREQAEQGIGPFPPGDPILDVLPSFEWGLPPSPLASESSRWGRLAGVTLATLFWNGIVAVFLNEMWGGHARGKPDWFLTFFLVPFVLIGIALMFAIIHSLLAFQNAQPEVIANPRTPRLGERLELAWRFTNAAGRLERVQIRLVGNENATYQVGTQSHTAQESFFEKILVDVPAPGCALGGRVSVELPKRAMHSFEASHNEVVWEIELKGTVHRWPDVKETYPLVVLPRAGDGKSPELA